MTPTITQIELLREVIGGRTVFAPKSDSDADIESFQILAEELIELCENNFLTGCRPKSESYSGKGQIVRVLVAGLTAAGRRLVQSSAALAADENDRSVVCPKCNHSLRATAKYCDDCGFPLSPTLNSTLPMDPRPKIGPTGSFVGNLLKSKYQITADIGKGGMGHVYRARHLELAKDVAIKIINKQFVSDEKAIKRFKREAQAAARLRHSNIVDIYDIDETEEPDRRPYIVMELIDGKSLKEVLADEGKLTMDRAVRLFEEICKGVSFAHQQGVIHRDIKPDNIMIIRREGEVSEGVKILDFGLAKMRESDDQSTITHIGTFMGTPVYSSPEQCRGEELDNRSDVYSLATVLFEMISGAPPFSGSNVCSKHQFEPVPALDSSLNIASEIVDVINRALAKNRDDRPAGVQEFSDALQTAYAGPSESGRFAAAVEQKNAKADELSPRLAQRTDLSTQTDSAIIEPLIEPWLNPPDHHARIDWYDLRVRVHNAGELVLRDFDVEVTIPRSHTHPNDSSVLLQHDYLGDARHYRLRDKPQSVLPGGTSPVLMQLTMMVPWEDYIAPTTEFVRVAVYAKDRCVGKKNFLVDEMLKPDRRDYIRGNASKTHL